MDQTPKNYCIFFIPVKSITDGFHHIDFFWYNIMSQSLSSYSTLSQMKHDTMIKIT
jgi:hypothetical protein